MEQFPEVWVIREWCSTWGWVPGGQLLPALVLEGLGRAWCSQCLVSCSRGRGAHWELWLSSGGRGSGLHLQPPHEHNGCSETLPPLYNSLFCCAVRFPLVSVGRKKHIRQHFLHQGSMCSRHGAIRRAWDLSWQQGEGVEPLQFFPAHRGIRWRGSQFFSKIVTVVNISEETPCPSLWKHQLPLRGHVSSLLNNYLLQPLDTFHSQV